MRILFLLLLIPSICFGDSESTFSGKTAQAHIIQASGDSLRPRPYLDFEGCSGQDLNGKTVITCSGSGGGSGSPGGSNTDVQYNSSGSFAGNSGFVYKGANVGIGTLTPGETLDVYGTVRTPGIFDDNLVNGNITLGDPQHLHGGATLVLDTIDNISVFENAQRVVTTGVLQADNDVYVIGNVGIGVLTPTFPLEIHNNVSSGNSWTQLNLVNDADYVTGFNLSPNGGNDPVWGVYSYGVSGNYDFCIGENGASEPFCIFDTSDGSGISIGYGNNAIVPPNNGLAVNGPSSFDNGFISTDGFGNIVINQSLAGSGSLIITSQSGSGNALYASALDNSLRSFNNIEDDGGSGISSWEGRIEAHSSISLGSSFSSLVAPVNGMIVQGNVGIGTAIPRQVLDVIGTVRMTGFAMPTNPISGYVMTSNSVGIGTWAPASGSSGSGTVTSVSQTVPAFLSISGSPVTTSGTLAIGLSGTALPIANGGTAATTNSAAATNIGVIPASPGGGNSITGDMQSAGNPKFVGQFLSSWNGTQGPWLWAGTTQNRYIFTVSNITTPPVEFSSNYANNCSGLVLGNDLVLSAGKWAGTIAIAQNCAPTASGTLSKNSGTGDATIAFSAVDSVSANWAHPMSMPNVLQFGFNLNDNNFNSNAPLLNGENVGEITFISDNGYGGYRQPGDAGIHIEEGSQNIHQSGSAYNIDTALPSTTTPWPTLDSTNSDSWTHVPLNRIQTLAPGSTYMVFNESNNIKRFGVMSPAGGGKSFDTSNYALQWWDLKNGLTRWPLWTLDIAQPEDIEGTFTVSGITNAPTVADIYTNNSQRCTLLTVTLTGSPKSGTIIATCSGAPSGSGTLTADTYPGNSGTGDATISFSAFATQNTYKDAMNIDHVTGNIGIGATSSHNRLDVEGTVTSNAFEVTAAGNVGVGSATPGSALDVQGTIRMTGFNIASGAASGNVLTSDGFGNGTWGSSNASQWATQNTTDVSLAGGNVGIGTTKTTTAALTIMNGNVGIGTWVPGSSLSIQGNISVGTTKAAQTLTIVTQSGIGPNFSLTGLQEAGDTISFAQTTSTNGAGAGLFEFLPAGAPSASPTLAIIESPGNISIGTTSNSNKLDVTSNMSVGYANGGTSKAAPTNGLIVKGNVGIGTNLPTQTLDVFGTIRISNLGGTLAVASGSNGCMGQGTLASGTITISTTCTPSTSQGIFLQDATTGSLVNVGTPTVGTVTGGTSFVINSSNALDSSNVNWWILKSS